MILLDSSLGIAPIVGISVGAFLFIILLLVAVLLIAKNKLTPQGEVVLNINEGEKEIEISPGGTILSTMSEQGIFIPSACGGGGTCGMCKCQVFEGAGDILPEAFHAVKFYASLAPKAELVLETAA